MQCANGCKLMYEFNRFYDGQPGAVVFLHGWGGDMRSFAGAFGALTDMGVPAVNTAFPREVPGDWGIYDYAALVDGFLSEHGVAAPMLVGHSFGGRVAIILAAQGRCGKLMLVDSAGLKPRFSLRRTIAVARYHSRVKRGKPLDGMGSDDYNNTEGDGRRVFVRIVNTHLDRLLPYIDCPTVIFWGRDDRDTPPYMAKRLHRHIRNSRLVFADGGHYGYVDSSYGFLRELKALLAE